MTITTRIHSLLFGSFVGADAYGNRYFRGRFSGKGKPERRWVIYNGKAEPSKVTPEWHGWLHHTADVTPLERPVKHHAWEQAPLPNLTGTKEAYLPPGNLRSGGQHAPTVAQYEAWKP